MWAWVVLAWAVDESPPTERPTDAEVSEEVIVYAELRVEEARREVIQELRDAGYDHEIIDLGDRVVFRHAAAWKGEVVLYDDGYAQVKRQPIHAEGARMPWAKKDSPLAWAGCLIWPWACIRVQGATVSERRWRNREARTVQRVQPKVRDWADRIADLSVDQKVEGLPAMLYALWEDGRPLGGPGPRLETYRERRAALLEFYGTRTETSWGRNIQQAIASFLQAVVQGSDHPVTRRELERFNADREVLLRIDVP